MPKITLDTLKNSSYESNTELTRLMRGFVADELPTNQPENVIRAAIVAGLPAVGQPHPTEISTRVVGYQIKLESSAMASGSVVYESPRIPTGTSKTQQNNYTYRDTTSLQSIMTSVVPADKGRPVYTVYSQNPKDKNSPQQTSITSVRYLRPMRVFVASGVFDKRPSTAIQNAVGKVNADSFLGLKPGFWLFSALDSDTRDSGKTYNITVQLMTPQSEDWSVYVLAKDALGKNAIVKATDAQTLRGQGYGIGVSQVNGMSRVGLYSLVSFAQVFQFRNLR